MRGLEAFTNLFGTRYEQHTRMTERISQLESRFAHRAKLGSEIDESTKMALLLSSTKKYNECNPVKASIHTIQNEGTTWDYV